MNVVIEMCSKQEGKAGEKRSEASALFVNDDGLLSALMILPV